jgi:MFS family permease
MGIISPLILVFIPISTTSLAVFVAFLFGFSLGIGMPNCMNYFTKITSNDNRGKYGGLVMLISGIGLFALGITDIGLIQVDAIVLSLWRLAGLLVLFSLPKSNKELNVNKTSDNVTYKTLLSQRSFILYLIPWLMFSLVTYLTTPIQYDMIGTQAVKMLLVVENIIIGISAVVAGHLSDLIGRKRIAMVGFVLLGLGYAVLGLISSDRANSANILGWYFYTVVDGIAWGILFVVFIVVIWGDLSYGRYSDKYYALGVLPFFISKYLQIAIGTDIAGAIPSYAIFSFTALFLFLAILPLYYAPETLSDKKIKERELKGYIEKAKKTAQKDEEKKQKSDRNKAQTNPEEKNREEYEKAKQLAEKYY